MDPETNLRGLSVIIKVVIIVALVKAVQAAIAYQKERQAVAGTEPFGLMTKFAPENSARSK